MLKHKRIRERGKLGLGKYFQELQLGERIAIVRNLSYKANFPAGLQGKVGTIIGRRGKAFIVSLMDGKKEKKFTLTREHIKRIR